MGRTPLNLSSGVSFIADPQSINRVPSGRMIDWPNVDSSYQVTPGVAPFTVTVTASASANATSITVAALPNALPSGTQLDFGTTKLAVTTALAAAGATAVAVRALPTALSGSETATYAGTSGVGHKVIRAGTPVGDTLSGNGSVSPRRATTNPAMGLLETDAIENSSTAAISGYGIINGGNIYETLLPTASGSPRVLPDAVKTELNTKGRFDWFKFEDNR